ncbi:unnamed protein product [Symbiodinium natans]|uniref:Uncharacterized protein n=1 Tax=Symbiodinium natans TaxID=878477 RepID=A0A812MGM5_9DINO|nr:unnamed protein product [Symbiodinium natans]
MAAMKRSRRNRVAYQVEEPEPLKEAPTAEPEQEAEVPTTPPSRSTSILRGARLGLLLGAPTAGALGLVAGAAGGAAFGAFLAPLTFGFAVPVCSGFSAFVGLIFGLCLGAMGGAAFGGFLGACAFFLGFGGACSVDPTSSHFVQVAVALLLMGITGPITAAAGAFLGMLSGAFLGFFGGLLLAPFSFGLSIPLAIAICAVIGAAIDAATGALLAACASGLLVRYHGWLLAGLRRAMSAANAAMNRFRWRLASFIAPGAAEQPKTWAAVPETEAGCADPPRRSARRRRAARA